MVLFVFAVLVALLGVGVYDLYNPGRLDVWMAGYHFAAVPTWEPVAVAAAVPMSFFLLHALWVGVRIRLLQGARRRASAWRLEPRPVEQRRPVERRPVERRRQVESWTVEERPAVVP